VDHLELLDHLEQVDHLELLDHPELPVQVGLLLHLVLREPDSILFQIRVIIEY
jgi:hypothetical protein